MQTLPLIVFSHLRWDFVYQRPQHLLSRLAKHRRVLFIEEPIHADGPDHWEKQSPEHNLLICRPRTNRRSHGFSSEQIDALKPMVESLLKEEKIDQYVVWCYTAMSYPLAAALEPEAVVFDVMDELSAFKGAPPEILEQERRLLELADVVFTGGPSLYRAKKDRHPNVHCFSSSVDARHFSLGKENSALPEIDDQKNLPRPRLGFYGVIDERMDIDLLAAMANAHPEWQIVMVGPVVKIDPADLPRPGNIHYMGQRSYTDLPKFLKGWDVCLLPFARNESTKFISPTKTLEYMAAERQIVSTPIRDVAEPYGDVVLLGDTHDQFIQACENALAMPEEERTARIKKMREVLSRTSWDATADAMNKLIDDAVADRKSKAAGGNAPAPKWTDAGDQLNTRVAVIGAGPTGLSATYHLGKDALLIDQNDRVGGWCRSIEDRGFTFDFAGHIMFSNDPYVHQMYKMLLGDNIHWQNREAWVFSKNVYTRYPFQGALYGLPPKVITECILGAVEARFGSLNSKADEQAKKLHGAAGGGNGALTGTAQMNGANGHANTNGHANAHANGNGHAKACSLNAKGVKDCCADGIAESEVPLAEKSALKNGAAASDEPKNFEEFIYKVWGAGVAKHFAIPYNKKIWAVDLKDMETSWLGGRVPLPNLEEMIKGALEPTPPPMGPNARFGYPLKGGFQALMDGFLPHVHDRLMLNTRVVGFSPSRKTLALSNGKTVNYDQLISTMPLPVLVRMAGEEAPLEVRKAAAGLRHTSVKCVNIGVKRAAVTEKHWIYYPEDTVFHRIFVQGNASPHCNPDAGRGGFGFTCEITYSPTKPLPCDGEDLIKLCIADAKRVGFINEDDEVTCSNVVDMPFAYVVYDHARPKNIATIRAWLAQHDIVLVGRYSEWEYYNSDHAFLAGKRGADEVRKLQDRCSRTTPGRVRDLADRAAESGWRSSSSEKSPLKEPAR
ncbi:MAG TPA: FAD-dependent oxidoreductase [Phycisphaerae bacterium]|nr:FAD-dependent oxidoreductase [Phycisphaerae bacterium]